jgi:phosphoribosylglycinamide formyltransferase-1
MGVQKVKAAVLVSGRGSNLQALIDACAKPDFPAEICLVISNIPDVYALERAQKAGIETDVINHKDYETREDFERALTERIQASGADMVCLAGFMRILTAYFTGAWDGRMINIHPSLLPDYKGLNTHQRAIDDGRDKAGCTVHYVVPDVDSGEIIVQKSVPILPGDTADILAARVLEQEHTAFPEALEIVAKRLLDQ